MHCALGTDPEPFGCHHGLARDGQPTKLCGGYLVARQASREAFLEALEGAAKTLDHIEGLPDKVRADFDAWATTADTEGKMDVYQVARAYSRKAHEPPCELAGSASRGNGRPAESLSPSPPKARE